MKLDVRAMMIYGSSSTLDSVASMNLLKLVCFLGFSLLHLSFCFFFSMIHNFFPPIFKSDLLNLNPRYRVLSVPLILPPCCFHNPHPSMSFIFFHFLPKLGRRTTLDTGAKWRCGYDERSKLRRRSRNHDKR